MNDVLDTTLRWLVPALIVFGVAAIAIAVVIWAVRRARRSPRARASAAAVRTTAGAALVRLDDAVAELDLEVGLSGALYDGSAPPALRRARISAQKVRDASFQEFADLTDDTPPALVRRGSARITARADDASAAIARARAEHAAWMQTHVSAGAQIAAARERWSELEAERGDPTALLDELSARFDRSEWAGAAAASQTATASLTAADRLLVDAEARAADPTRNALTVLAGAERALRSARQAARAVDETYRLVTDAALALPSEFEAAHGALRQAATIREALAPADAERLAAEMRTFQAGLAAIQPDAARRPTASVDAIARLRDRLDLALGDARSAQQRLRGARTALPGTLAAARGAVARAEASVPGAGADARSRLDAAQRELAAARAAGDPIDALDAGRRSLRLAEDAIALADHDRLAAASGMTPSP